MASNNPRSSTVTLVLGLMAVAGLYGLYMAMVMWSIAGNMFMSFGAQMAGLSIPSGPLGQLLAAILTLASLGLLYAAWQGFGNPTAQALSWAVRSTLAWTVVMGLAFVIPFVDPGPSSLADEALEALVGTPASGNMVYFGVATLVGLFLLYQLRRNGEVLDYFGSTSTPPPVGPEVIVKEKVVYRDAPLESPTIPPFGATPIARLVRVRRGQPVGEFPVTSSPNSAKLVIGRDRRQSQIHVADDQTVSRSHAALIVDQGRVFIEDLASQWGTEVNGQRLLQRQLLYHNDHIRLGDSEFTFVQARPQDP